MTLLQFFLLGAWLLLACGIAHRIGFFRWRPLELAAPPELSFLRLISTFALFFILPALFVFLLRASLSDARWAFFAVNWLQIAFVWGNFLIILLCWWSVGEGRRRLFFRWGGSSSWIWAVGIGALTWLLVFPFIALLTEAIEGWATSRFGVDEREQLAVQMTRALFGKSLIFAINTVNMVVLVPIIEELLFRGFLYSWLRRKIGIEWGIACSALLFALFHLSSKQSVAVNVALMLSLSILGAVMAYLYEREGSLWAPIGLHACFNGMTTLALITQMG